MDGQTAFDGVTEAAINVREYGGTYIARAAGLGVTASCTAGKREAVEACAAKLFGRGGCALNEVTGWTWLASRKAVGS